MNSKNNDFLFGEISQVSDEEMKFFEQIIELDRREFSFPWQKRNWEDCQKSLSNYRLFYVCNNAKELRGFVLFQLSPYENLAHLLKIIICQQFRGQQLGLQLFNYALSFLRANNYSRVFLEVETENLVALRFYEQSGFKKLNTVLNFYGDKKNAHRMLLKISFLK